METGPGRERGNTNILAEPWHWLGHCFSEPGKAQALLVDENGLFRQGLGSLLQQAGVAVVGEAETAEDGEALIRQLPSGTVVFCSTSLLGYRNFLGRLGEECSTAGVIRVNEDSRADIQDQAVAGRPTACITREATEQVILGTLQAVDKRVKGAMAASPGVGPQSETAQETPG